MKNISILGSTGSIGKNVLEVVKQFPDKFCIKALAGATNTSLIAEQIKAFEPDIAVVIDDKHAAILQALIGASHPTEIYHGDSGYKAAATHPDTEMVVSSIVGAAGLKPTVAALTAGIDVALANKETLVMAGDYVMALAGKNNIKILPVDSEHSAVFQCLQGHNDNNDLDRIILTASGGPFRNRPATSFGTITPEDALDHPTWDMGQKISIDSASLMNKGLEVIEAKYLFDISAASIDVVIHPQSIIHSMVSFIDGSVLAHMGEPDMKGAIAYALSWPARLPLKLRVPDFASIGSLTFEKPDRNKFPCLGLAFDALEAGGTMPAVLNAANEQAVYGFLSKKIPFTRIPVIIARTMAAHITSDASDIDTIIDADHWARQQAEVFF